MRRGIVIIVIALAGLPACGGGGSSSATRTALVDYNYDQFASSLFAFMPLNVSVHPGDTVDFKQAWTGEPHTVTGGTATTALGEKISPYLNHKVAVPAEEPADIAALEQQLPAFFGDGPAANQTAAQPCFIDSGTLPEGGKPCKQRPQPAFNGRQEFYNSGFVKYGGNNGNQFKVPIAKDATLGTYFFYCTIHGAAMSNYIHIVPKSIPIASQSAINKQTKAELDKQMKRLVKGDGEAQKGKDKPAGVDVVSGGSIAENDIPFGTLLEFYPKTFNAKVGQKVTWDLEGHTVSFHVPKYIPIVLIDKDGTVRGNPKTTDAVNAPKAPDSNGGEQHGPPPPPTKIDAGSYDGSKFLSSGQNDNEWFSITFTKPGTYQYACLVHPRMIGTVVVK